MYGSRFWGWVLVTLVVAGCASCGDDNGTQKNNGMPDDDAGDVTEPNNVTPGDMDDPDPDDVAMPDMGGPDDMDDDAGRDMPPDMGPVDSDGDGVTDDEDNCPDTANEDQADRDRDGLGDECDILDYIHDPTNPPAIPSSVTEDEDVISNDSSLAGLDYGLTLPFGAQGTVGEVSDAGDPDLDFYSFEIDEPTALLIRVTGAQGFWAGAIVLGMDWSNANLFRATIATDIGVPTERELFLPHPGRYTIVVSDARNFIASQGNVGGAGSDYAVTVSDVPLPEPEALELPSAPVATEFDGTLDVFEIDVSGVGGVHVQSTGVSGDQNSFHSPTLALYDPDAKLTLAMNSLGQVGDDFEANLSVKLTDENRLLLIDDYSQRVGNASTSVLAEPVNLDVETETPAAPADSRMGDVPWVSVGTSMQGNIGQPRAAGPTELDGDVDFVLFAANRGETIRVTLTPDASSQLEGVVEFGHLVEQGGDSFFITLHEAPTAEIGADGSVEYLLSAVDDGELAARIQHGPNEFNANPVGGTSYGYTVSVESVTPMTSQIPTIPGSVDVDVPPGGMGIATVDASQDDILTAREDSTLFSEMRVLDASDWRVLAGGTQSLTFAVPRDGQYYVVTNDIIGRGTEAGSPQTIFVDQVQMMPLGALPATATGVLDMQPRHLHTLNAMAGQKLDIRVHAPNFFPQITVFDQDFMPVGPGSFERKVLEIPADGTYTIVVAQSSGNVGADFDYTLGVQEIMPSPSGGLPFSTTGTLDDLPFAQWYEVPVVTDGVYAGAILGADEPGFSPRVSAYNPDDLSLLKTTVAGQVRWKSTYDGVAWVAVFDLDNGGDPLWTYDLGMDEVQTSTATIGQTVSGQLDSGVNEDLYTLTTTGGMIDVEVSTIGDWRPSIRLLRTDTYDPITEATQVGSRLRYAVSTMQDYAVSVRATDPSLAGPLDYDVTIDVVQPMTPLAEVEPNDAFAEAQQVTSPTIIAGTSGADRDRYQLSLVRGQRVWALSTDRNMGGVDRFDARVYVHDPTDAIVMNNAFSGEGFMPAIYGFEVPDSGNWQFVYGPRDNATLMGDYHFYLMATGFTDVAESEPNDDTATAQDLGTVDGVVRVSSFVDTADPVDVYAVTIGKSGARLRVSLENADPGHELRVIDSNDVELGASGPAFDGTDDPAITLEGLAAGIYYVEFTEGTASGAADLFVIVD